jgi:tRNA pseudouridine55 synthase
LVDKPAGITSHDAVDEVRRRLGMRQVGHTGTLDPFATGLLVVLVGRATRLARFVEGQPKTYLATARLGTRTDTDDLTGSVLTQRSDPPTIGEQDLREALSGFVGVQRQRPPNYSA